MRATAVEYKGHSSEGPYQCSRKSEQSQQCSSRGVGLVDSTLVVPCLPPHSHVRANNVVSQGLWDHWLLLLACLNVVAGGGRRKGKKERVIT